MGSAWAPNAGAAPPTPPVAPWSSLSPQGGRKLGFAFQSKQGCLWVLGELLSLDQ